MADLSILITAGGIGKRMGADVPKQFLLLCGRPILIHTLERLHGFAPKAQFIITLPEEWKQEWQQLCTKHNCDIKHEVISGGKERFNSVKKALEHCSGNNVLIHDGVRPLVSKDCFERALDSVKSNVASIPFVAINESMRRLEGEQNHAVNRDEYLIIQTPQCFHLKELKEGMKSDFDFKDFHLFEQAVIDLESELKNKITFVTLSEQGVYVKEGIQREHLSAHLRDIADVSGAGDTVIAVATACLAAGLSSVQMANIANIAGGLVCESSGVVAIEKDLLLEEVENQLNGH